MVDKRYRKNLTWKLHPSASTEPNHHFEGLLYQLFHKSVDPTEKANIFNFWIYWARIQSLPSGPFAKCYHICTLAHIIILQIKKKEVRLSFHENWPENYKSSTLKWLLLQFSAVWHKNEAIWGHSYLVGWYALEPICLFKCRKLAIAGSFSYTDVVTEYRACTWDSVGHPILSNYFFTKNKLRQYFLF